MNTQSKQAIYPEIINKKYLAFRVWYVPSNRQHIIRLSSSLNVLVYRQWHFNLDAGYGRSLKRRTPQSMRCSNYCMSVSIAVCVVTQGKVTATNRRDDVFCAMRYYEYRWFWSGFRQFNKNFKVCIFKKRALHDYVYVLLHQSSYIQIYIQQSISRTLHVFFLGLNMKLHTKQIFTKL